MNFTVDDADPSFSYSNGWAVQSDSDADRDEFFQSTYHVATADGASMSFQFQGSAFTLYGSKGPGHAKYQVQFDATVVTLDASADETAFRQELFSHVFSSNGTSAVHLVKMTAVLSGDGVKGKWLDVDYITFTSGSGATSAIGTATSAPPWEAPTASTLSSSSFTPFSASTSPAASSSSSSKVPTILAVLFGVLIGLALLGVIIFLVLRRIYSARRARERAFRYGQSSINPSGFSASSHKSAPSATGGGGGSGIIDTVASVFSGSPHSPTPSSPMMNYTHMHDVSAPSLSPSNPMTAVEMRSMSIDRPQTREGYGGRDGAGTPSTGGAVRPLMSASPIAWTRQKVAGGHKGDADSLRTDFLQV